MSEPIHHIAVCGSATPYVPEHDWGRMFNQMVDDVWSGQVENVKAIIAVDLVNGTATDVTAKIASACFTRSYNLGETPLPCVRSLLVDYGFCWYVERQLQEA